MLSTSRIQILEKAFRDIIFVSLFFLSFFFLSSGLNSSEKFELFYSLAPVKILSMIQINLFENYLY